MNIPLLLGGAFGSLIVIMFIAMAIIDGVRDAAIVIGLTLATAVGITLLVAFWIWVAGGFA